jgi:DNA-binding transcriptional LysR family regulator
MTTIRLLRTFVAAAHGGSFTAAANKVALTQAAVGLQMRTLEAELKQSLFDKTGRTMTLSAAGRALLPRAERLLADVDALHRDVQDPQTIAGSVTIGVMISAMGLLSEALVELKMRHPGLDVHLRLCHPAVMPEQVRQGEFDVGLLVEPSKRDFDGLQWTLLYEEPIVMVASSAVATPRSDVARLVRTQPFLRFDRRTPTGARIEQTLRRRGLKPRDFIELNSVLSIVELVRQRAGVALVPLLKTFDWEHDPALCVLPISGRPAIRRVGMLEPAGGTPITRAVREQVQARLKRLHAPVAAAAKPARTRAASSR